MTYVELQLVSDGNINGINLIKIRWFNQKKKNDCGCIFCEHNEPVCIYIKWSIFNDIQSMYFMCCVKFRSHEREKKTRIVHIYI